MKTLSDKRCYFCKTSAGEEFCYMEYDVKKSIKELDEYFEQGFNAKMNRFMLYPTEWEELKQKIFGGDLVK